jgi:hypothetical protein
MPLIPAFRRQKQVNFCEFQGSQGYTEKPCLKKKKRKKESRKFLSMTGTSREIPGNSIQEQTQ